MSEYTLTKSEFKKRLQVAYQLFTLYLAQEMQENAPTNSSYLKTNIRAESEGNKHQIVMPIYGLYVEYGCFFDPKTKVITKEGEKNISELSFDDLVWTGKEFKTIIQKEKLDINYPINKVKISTENHYLEVTEDHPIMTQRGLIPAILLKETDEVFIYEKEIQA